MNWLSCDEPKNSRIAAMTGLAFTRSCGMAVDISWYTLIFSLMARSIRTRPMRNWFSSNSPTARTRLAIDFDERFFRGANGIFVERAREHHADIVAVREKHIDFGDARFGEGLPKVRGQRLIGFEHDFAGLPVDHVGDAVRAFKVGQRSAYLGNLRFDQFLEQGFGDALVGADNHLVGLGIADFVSQLAVDDARRNVPEQLLIAQRDALHLVERAQDLFVGLHAQRAQENGAEEFAFAVNAHVENVLGVVLEFHPRPAVGNDFSEEVGAVVGALEKHARRTMQLGNDDAFRAVDDERAILGHQRNIPIENFLLLDVADGFRAGIGILVVNGQANG